MSGATSKAVATAMLLLAGAAPALAQSSDSGKTGLSLPDGGNTKTLTKPGAGGVAGTGLGGSTSGTGDGGTGGKTGGGTAPGIPGTGTSVKGPAGQGIDGQGTSTGIDAGGGSAAH